MNLLAIIRTIWRHRFVTFPIIVLTLLAAAYEVAVKPSQYQTTSTYVLVSPPGPPTPGEVKHDPALANINPDNPYTRYGDPAVVSELLSEIMSSDSERQAMVNAGADSRYVVAPSVAFGYATPMVQITGVGSSAQAAINTANVVSRAANDKLNQLQATKGVNPRYRITTIQAVIPDRAQLQASGKLRSLVSVFGAGVVVLLLVISLLNAVSKRRVLAQAEQALRESGDPRVSEPAVPPYDPRLVGANGGGSFLETSVGSDPMGDGPRG